MCEGTITITADRELRSGYFLACRHHHASFERPTPFLLFLHPFLPFLGNLPSVLHLLARAILSSSPAKRHVAAMNVWTIFIKMRRK